MKGLVYRSFMNKITAQKLIEIFQLLPHPEGGSFRETYRSSGEIFSSSQSNRFKGARSFSTAIYFLLPAGTQSRLHRIASDEIWHFYLGGPMTLIQISPDGDLEKIVLGQDILAGQKLQHTVPAGYWFGGFPNKETEFSFVGCTVAPGFDFQDFEMAEREKLIKMYPRYSEEILALT